MPSKLLILAAVIAAALWVLPAYYRVTYSSDGYIVPFGCEHEECHLVGTIKYGTIDGTMQVETPSGVVHVVNQENIKMMVVSPKAADKP